MVLSTESENSCDGCLFLSLNLNCFAVYMLKFMDMIEKTARQGFFLPRLITGVWFWRAVHVSVEPGKAKSSTLLFLRF